jgi:cystathionine beta-lyase/cystathionine gamma-synthase
VVCGDNVYGGTERMFRNVWQGFGVEFSFVDTSDVEALRAAVRPETKLVHVETPTNPLMQLSDIAACAEVAHGAGGLLSVDNTFATPYLQRPLQLGADIVMHSTTKYLGGHSDVIGGALIVSDDDLAEKLHWQQFATGAIPGPMDSWLLLRSTKTLHVRMRAHCDNAGRIAEHLAARSELAGVFYPGLPDHPQHELARRQMNGFGGMISVETGSGERAARLAENTRIFQLAESLGGVESLISVPARMTHASVSPERRAEMGLTEGLVRLSVGIEDVADLIADLDVALSAM